MLFRQALWLKPRAWTMAAPPRWEMALFKQPRHDDLPISSGAPLTPWAAAPSHLAGSLNFMRAIEDEVYFCCEGFPDRLDKQKVWIYKACAANLDPPRCLALRPAEARVLQRAAVAEEDRGLRVILSSLGGEELPCDLRVAFDDAAYLTMDLLLDYLDRVLVEFANYNLALVPANVQEPVPQDFVWCSAADWPQAGLSLDWEQALRRRSPLARCADAKRLHDFGEAEWQKARRNQPAVCLGCCASALPAPTGPPAQRCLPPEESMTVCAACKELKVNEAFPAAQLRRPQPRCMTCCKQLRELRCSHCRQRKQVEHFAAAMITVPSQDVACAACAQAAAAAGRLSRGWFQCAGCLHLHRRARARKAGARAWCLNCAPRGPKQPQCSAAALQGRKRKRPS